MWLLPLVFTIHSAIVFRLKTNSIRFNRKWTWNWMVILGFYTIIVHCVILGCFFRTCIVFIFWARFWPRDSSILLLFFYVPRNFNWKYDKSVRFFYYNLMRNIMTILIFFFIQYFWRHLSCLCTHIIRLCSFPYLWLSQ